MSFRRVFSRELVLREVGVSQPPLLVRSFVSGPSRPSVHPLGRPFRPLLRPGSMHGRSLTCTSVACMSMRVREHKRQPMEEEPEATHPQVEALLAEAASLVDSSLWEQALRTYTRAVGCDPNEPKAFEQRGRLLFAMNKYNRAKSDFEQVCRISPKYVPAYVAVARCYAALGQHDKALQWYDDVISIDDKCAPAHVGRGDTILSTQGQLLPSARMSEPDADAEAMASYSKALVADPNMIAAWCGVGTVAIKRGHYAESKEAYKRALDAALSQPPEEAVDVADRQNQLVDIYGSLGVLEELEGNTDKAIDLFSEGISIEPSSFLHVKRAASYLLREDIELGVTDARKALDVDADNHAAYLMLGQGLMSLAEFDEARTALITFAAEERRRQAGMHPAEKAESDAQLAEIEKLCSICKKELDLAEGGHDGGEEEEEEEAVLSRNKKMR